MAFESIKTFINQCHPNKFSKERQDKNWNLKRRMNESKNTVYGFGRQTQVALCLVIEFQERLTRMVWRKVWSDVDRASPNWWKLMKRKINKIEFKKNDENWWTPSKTNIWGWIVLPFPPQKKSFSSRHSGCDCIWK